MSDRKTFEKWAKDKGYSLDFLKHPTGGAYLDYRTQAAWQQWNADPYPDKDPWEAYEFACKRISELKSVNGDLYEALRDAMRTARKDFATKEDFEDAYPEQVAALAKARRKEPPR